MILNVEPTFRLMGVLRGMSDGGLPLLVQPVEGPAGPSMSVLRRDLSEPSKTEAIRIAGVLAAHAKEPIE